MRATFIIPDPVHRGLKQYAAKRRITLSEVATEFLIRGLRKSGKPKRPFRLPTFSAGPPKIDVANREALFDFLDRERDKRLYGNKKER